MSFVQSAYQISIKSDNPEILVSIVLSFAFLQALGDLTDLDIIDRIPLWLWLFGSNLYPNINVIMTES